MSWLSRRRQRKHVESILKQCGCVCFCPNCRTPLNDQPGEALDDSIYRYSCRCGAKPCFDFDYPVPVKVADHSIPEV